MLLVPLDRTLHDVDAFSSGVRTCDDDLYRQSKKPRNRCLVAVDGRRIMAFGRYSIVDAGPDGIVRPLVRIDYLARDLRSPAGTGTQCLLSLFVRITKDPKAATCSGVLIDCMDCGDPEQTQRRWNYFVEKARFTPLRDDGHPHGYAFMKMETVCAFRGIWAVISRDLGHAFHGIAGSHFSLPGRLANG